MWLASVLPSLVGFVLNAFIACTWFVGGKKLYNSNPLAIKVCVFGGLIYSGVETFPSLFLKVALYMPKKRCHTIVNSFFIFHFENSTTLPVNVAPRNVQAPLFCALSTAQASTFS
jgi:hypothetical protein